MALEHMNARCCELRLSAVSLVLSALLFNSTAVSAQDWCAGHVTDRDKRVVQKIAKPGYLEPYIDPAFKTRIQRVTDSPAGSARRTLYNTMQPWNADESRLVLLHTNSGGTGHHLYNGKTYEYIRALEFLPADTEGIYWDEQDSSTLYYIQRRPGNDAFFGKLVKYNVNTKSKSVAADLDSICGKPSERRGITVKGGDDIQGIRNNRIGLRCNNDSVNRNSLDITFNVNVRTGKISQTLMIDPAKAQGSNNHGFRPDLGAAPLPSGKRVFVQNSVFDTDMNFLYSLDSAFDDYNARNGRKYLLPKPEHTAMGQLPNGHDAVFSSQYDALRNSCDYDRNGGVGALVAQDVEAGSCQVFLGMSNGWGYPLSGIHPSALSQKNPGWVTTTTIGYDDLEYLENGREAPVLFSELTLTRADRDNPTTCRLAHVRTVGKKANRLGNYRDGYFGEPHAVMSPSGSRVLFNSDWYDSGTVDTYAINLGDPVDPVDPVDSELDLKTTVRMDESPKRVYVDFVNTNRGPEDYVTIAVAGTPERQLKMWFYTNGTQRVDGSRPEKGRLGFLQQYVGIGDFEARLFINGNRDEAVERVKFTVSEEVVVEPPKPEADYRLQKQVRMEESPPRVYVDFVDSNRGGNDRITIAPAGAPDNQWKMWFYTNGSQYVSDRGPETGRLGFLQQYIGRGQFEARLFIDGNKDEAIERIFFTVP